ncbi:phosphonoacetaldehyde hydrolase [Pseudoramibacter sp.]|jgi:phosphonoacetaldehyde hydrolase|uniref:phosphonoacetaldehyde hydrolase n=1 Tax=Pseudoramibacter sp. TaxID=2034862 RepID=UPI0025E18EC7|nr:phosphonoacetaldehyde hydrolase [Pseudoramibacter sp.]MCH4072036.1 phosphonoacetaldehyde hydrolase [Pseudoramibacter sp.]MCH4105805.1 phosphonoacetaldehyde hydrolase [Pseudoramibacter sp.]
MKQGIKMVVFDWAGTTVDYGSMAPMDVFDEVFKNAGVKLTPEEIAGPMGLDKRMHIKRLLDLDKTKAMWQKRYHRDTDEGDVTRLFKRFEARLDQVVGEYSTPLDGVVETVKALRDAGVRVGSTTGYTSDMMKRVLPAAEAGGYRPECVVTPDVVGSGRPRPFMIYECMRQLDVYPPAHVLKVGDTIADIQEGRNAGVWTCGVLEGSSTLGLRKEERDALDDDALAARKAEAEARYKAAGADFVADSIRDIPEIVKALNQKLSDL